MGLIDRLFRRTRQSKSTPLQPSVNPNHGQFEVGDATGSPSRRKRIARKKARKCSKQSRRVNR